MPKHWPIIANSFRLKSTLEYNNVEGSGFSHSPEKNRDEFVKFLESCNMIVNIRHSKGKDIDAACGQLAGKTKRNA